MVGFQTKDIVADQLLILQPFPRRSGLQDPVLLAFQVQVEFVQIIHVGGNHWCALSTLGCNEGEVKVYDSLYPSVTLRVIGSFMCTGR